jgi:hypothetical protein
MSVTLKNTAVCAFIIPGVGEGSSLAGLIAPGESLTVDDSIVECDFVQNLVEIGHLQMTGAALLEKGDEEEPEGEEIDLLRAEAEDLGIAIDKRWGIAKIKEAINNA